MSELTVDMGYEVEEANVLIVNPPMRDVATMSYPKQYHGVKSVLREIERILKDAGYKVTMMVKTDGTGTVKSDGPPTETRRLIIDGLRAKFPGPWTFSGDATLVAPIEVLEDIEQLWRDETGDVGDPEENPPDNAFYDKNKLYAHKTAGYTAKYVGKHNGRHTYEIVSVGLEVGDRFTPKEPERWFRLLGDLPKHNPDGWKKVLDTDAEANKFIGNGAIRWYGPSGMLSTLINPSIDNLLIAEKAFEITNDRGRSKITRAIDLLEEVHPRIKGNPPCTHETLTPIGRVNPGGQTVYRCEGCKKTFRRANR